MTRFLSTYTNGPQLVHLDNGQAMTHAKGNHQAWNKSKNAPVALNAVEKNI